MGEWTDSKQEFPEEYAANYVNGRFDPQAARALREKHQQQGQPALPPGDVRTQAQRHKPRQQS